ncbi:TlyA family RNA methyltransferase [Micrococcales bacterium 31B]|nr:TlyA family RNA methyltransferase [Micrococcales bacterium 31B]
MKRQRLDAELVRRNLARSRQQAQEFIAAGRVFIAGAKASKPATQVDTAAALVVRDADEGPDYASRGAYKLLGALHAFEPLGLRVAGRRCLDAGASTGGFTDVLLRHGAASVVAVDVGYGQLVWALQQDERVEVHDRTNIRALTADLVAPAPTLVVGDLSFISLSLVLPALRASCAPDADFVMMVKPQFEVGKERLGAGGVVRSAGLRADAVDAVIASARALDLGLVAVTASPLPGPSGNVEYFVWLRSTATPGPHRVVIDAAETGEMVRRAVADGPR